MKGTTAMLTIREVARLLNVSRQWIYEHRAELPQPHKFGSNVRYRQDEIEAYVESRRIRVGGEA